MGAMFPEHVLEKWARERLTQEPSPDGLRRYVFTIDGSTCTNGGTPFAVRVVVNIEMQDGEPIIRTARFEIPTEDQPAAGQMCDYRATAGGRHASALDDWTVVGLPLAEAVRRSVPTDHAGCICTEPMRNRKLQMALSTIAYSLRSAGEA
jgi:hypothetical protein